MSEDTPEVVVPERVSDFCLSGGRLYFATAPVRDRSPALYWRTIDLRRAPVEVRNLEEEVVHLGVTGRRLLWTERGLQPYALRLRGAAIHGEGELIELGEVMTPFVHPIATLSNAAVFPGEGSQLFELDDRAEDPRPLLDLSGKDVGTNAPGTPEAWLDRVQMGRHLELTARGLYWTAAGDTIAPELLFGIPPGGGVPRIHVVAPSDESLGALTLTDEGKLCFQVTRYAGPDGQIEREVFRSHDLQSGETTDLCGIDPCFMRAMRAFDGDLYWRGMAYRIRSGKRDCIWRLPAGATEPELVVEGISGGSRIEISGDALYFDASAGVQRLRIPRTKRRSSMVEDRFGGGVGSA